MLHFRIKYSGPASNLVTDFAVLLKDNESSAKPHPKHHIRPAALIYVAWGSHAELISNIIMASFHAWLACCENIRDHVSQ